MAKLDKKFKEYIGVPRWYSREVSREYSTGFFLGSALRENFDVVSFSPLVPGFCEEREMSCGGILTTMPEL